MRAPSSMGRGGRGGRGGGRGFGGRGGGRGFGGRGGFRDEGPPEFVVEVGQVMHECESEMVCKLTERESKVPYFNAPIYLENKKKIGKVDEVRFMMIIIVVVEINIYDEVTYCANSMHLHYDFPYNAHLQCPQIDLWNDKGSHVYSQT
jgi:hypothetical protein